MMNEMASGGGDEGGVCFRDPSLVVADLYDTFDGLWPILTVDPDVFGGERSAVDVFCRDHYLITKPLAISCRTCPESNPLRCRFNGFTGRTCE
jgi:hypothetical protein